MIGEQMNKYLSQPESDSAKTAIFNTWLVIERCSDSIYEMSRELGSNKLLAEAVILKNISTMLNDALVEIENDGIN